MWIVLLVVATAMLVGLAVMTLCEPPGTLS
jgi:hypothetical protein